MGKTVTAPKAPGARGRIPGSVAIIAVLVFLGVTILIYPGTASWFSQLQQARDVLAYGNTVERLGPEGRDAALASAQAYNDALQGGTVADPFGKNPQSSTDANELLYRRELSLNPEGIMARLRIPAIGADLPVFHGTGDAVLRRGVGHLMGTALPVGGIGSHAVLTGHAGVPEATLFSHLEDTAVGDLVEVEVYGEVLSYRIIDTRVVLPSQTESLLPEHGEDLLSLVTCTPIGINSHRLIVTAERLSPPVAGTGSAEPAEMDPPWWAMGMVLGAFASGGILWLGARSRRTR